MARDRQSRPRMRTGQVQRGNSGISKAAPPARTRTRATADATEAAQTARQRAPARPPAQPAEGAQAPRQRPAASERLTAAQRNQATSRRHAAAPAPATEQTTNTRRATDRRSKAERSSSTPRFSSVTTPSAGAGPVGGRRSAAVKGMRLRTKFMLAMAGMTAGTTLLLGLILTTVSSSFLFGQTQHKGIELAKMAAQVGRAVLDAPLQHRNQQEREVAIQQYLANAATWGNTTDRFSDVLAVTFDGTDISGLGRGEPPRTTSLGNAFTSITIPRLGSVTLGDDITVARTTRNGIPVFRFKVQLNRRGTPGEVSEPSYLENGFVWVDLAADKVNAIRINLFIVIGVGVLVSLVIVLLLANWLAGSITKPVRILLRDMEVVAHGNLDHQTKSHSSDEIGQLANSFNIMTRELKVAQVALVEQEKAEYELSIAREVQQQLLPADLPEIPGYEPFAYYKGAKAVSGDYYDFIPLGNGLWGFIIADVSGKGIPGSMVMAVTRTIVRLVANRHLNRAAETLKETNRLIAKQIKRGMFVTAFYAILDTRTGACTLSSAGHNPMVVYRAASRTHELVGPKGIAIGFNEGPLFDKNIQEVQTILHPGDSLVLYTDGFPEAMNEDNEEYGDEPFYAQIAASGHLGSQGMVEHLVQAIAKHRGRAPQSDDLTILTIRRS